MKANTCFVAVLPGMSEYQYVLTCIMHSSNKPLVSIYSVVKKKIWGNIVVAGYKNIAYYLEDTYQSSQVLNFIPQLTDPIP